jgi:cytochrome c553
MKRLSLVLALALLPIVALGAEPPPWAFPAAPPGAAPSAEDPAPLHVPGSTQTYTHAQLEDNFNAPDWFPNEHSPMPQVVAHGSSPDVWACAKCHLSTGFGHPESANLAGMNAGYLLRQLAEFKSGERKGAKRMTTISQALSPEDARQAAAWFAAQPGAPWVKVVEATDVPKSYVGEGNMRLPSQSGGTEPLGDRIIELPQDPARALLRDPHSGFVAYVPRGSVARGKMLVETGGNGKTIPCAICHGDGLKGIGEVPALAGRSPIYVFRQLYDIQTGVRTGVWTELMKSVVTKLNEDDMLAISAYVASRQP